MSEREDGPSGERGDDPVAWAAVGELYHRYLTGLLLALVMRHGAARAADVVFATFRRQHLELFLPGLAKLGLTELPPAVACAQYHVLSNALGGVRVEWIPESDTKSWVRYLPPRWIFDGTAVCGIPTEVSRAMLRGWHGHNGVSLGNDRLGFVATMQTTDGQPGLEGYYIEEDRPLEVEERVRFRPGERPSSPSEPLASPRWSNERLAKVERNYSVAYVRTILPALCSVLGPADGAALGRVAGRQIGMQYHTEIMGRLTGGGDSGSSDAFAGRFARLLTAHGSRFEVELAGDRVKLIADRVFEPAAAPAVFEGWNGLWEGLAAMEGLELVVTDRLDRGDRSTTWEVRGR
ncbi:MAG: hypothetical protein OEV40_10100 [Acidimicrobiia bacterium]|nr:hypothetical protein [Acidimicrobiia bacterium]